MPKKIDQYDTERKQLLDRIFDILGISKDNNSFFLNDIDKNQTKIDQINALDIDIKKYFCISNWSAFKSKPIKRRYYSLLKSIFKDMNIKYKTETHRNTIFDGNNTGTSTTITSVKVIIDL